MVRVIFPRMKKGKTIFGLILTKPPNSKGLQCYQGYVALTSNKERTLRLYRGSHQLHEPYFSQRGIKSTSNWQKKIDPEYLGTIQDRKMALQVPNGALVIWESRVFHQNQYGSPQSEERVVQYVCYLPRNHPKNTSSMTLKRQNILMNVELLHIYQHLFM